MRARYRCIWLTLLLAICAFSQQYAFVPVLGSPRHLGGVWQDHLGRFWVVADGDVKCFDGTRFFSLAPFGLPADVPGRPANTLAEDPRGGIWIAGTHALYRFAAGKIAAMYAGPVSNILALSNGMMLATMGHPNGPSGDTASFDFIRFSHSPSGWVAQPLANWRILAGNTLRLGHHNELLFPCETAYCESSLTEIAAWQPGSRTAPLARPAPYADTRSVLRDRFGCLWFRSLSGAKYSCPGDHQFHELPPEIASNGLAIEEAPDGSILIASSFGLAIGRPGHFHVITAANGVPSGSPLIARDGTLWLVAINAIGRLISPLRFEYWTEREGLNAPFSILRTEHRTFASSGLGISFLSDDRSRWIPLPNTRSLGVVRNLIRGPGDTLLAVLHHHGVAQLSFDGKLLARSAPDADPQAMHLARDGDGNFWLAGSGISRVNLRGARIDLIPQPVPAPRTLGTDIQFEPHSRDLFACYAGGLAFRHHDAWQLLTTRNGLIQNPCRTLAPLPDGDIWVGYFNGNPLALVRRSASHPVEVTHFWTGHHQGRALRYFFGLDTSGRLWRGDDSGVYVSSPARAARDQWIELNQQDGLPAIDTNQQSFYSDPDGSVWWAAENTISHFNPPPNLLDVNFAPRVFLSGYSLAGNQARFAEALPAIPYGTPAVAYLGSLQFSRRNALQLRYRLDNHAWLPATDFQVPLDKLRWGSHKLEVQARLFTGPWSQPVLSSFAVLRPVWLQMPFLTGISVLMFLIAVPLYRRYRLFPNSPRPRLPDLTPWRLAVLTPEAQELLGTSLGGRYRLDAVLARGGFATVFSARDTHDSRKCAIKVFRRELDSDWLARRFQQELAALKQIRHPNVVRIYDHGTTTTGAPYLAMEFIEGKTLREPLPEHGFPPAETAAYLRQIASALHTLHQHGIYHRDLKPENLIISQGAHGESCITLIDFSIAIVRSPDETIHGLSRAAGTIYYMAPEQVTGYADSASDIYSLAKVLLEMLTGSRLSLLLPNASLDLPLRVRSYLADSALPLGIGSINLICAALAFDPARRPRNVLSFALPIARDLETSRS